MAESLTIDSSQGREVRYRELLPQLQGLTAGEPNTVANLANTAAALKQTFGFFWVGFYLVDKEQLVLGPFQGDIACTRIDYGRGVCGTAWASGETQIVPDVDQFPGHIACSSLSRSEIVVPIKKNGQVIGVLDVDSDIPDDFSKADAIGLETICQWLETILTGELTA